jgi:hypothetical protein
MNFRKEVETSKRREDEYVDEVKYYKNNIDE